MSIIQSIRERGALISVIIIALSLLGFIAMDAFTGRSNFFGGGPSKNMGRVNGENIDANAFREMVQATEQNMQAQGYPSGEATSQMAIENTWNQEVDRIILEQELNKLGMGIGTKEMSDLLYGSNPSPIAKQYMSGQDGYNPEQVRQTIRQIEKSGNSEQQVQLSNLLKYIKQSRLQEKFNSLLSNTIYVPKWKVEKQDADNSQMAKVSFVRKAYTDIADSSVKVTDQEIRDYVNKHKDEYQQEESRGISYVAFSASPSAKDSADVRESVAQLIPQMLAATNMEEFLAREGGTGFYNGYISGKNIQIAHKDSIFKIPVGQVYGPYLDGSSYSIAKLLGAKQLPDTVKVRHILIGLRQVDPQTGQQVATRDSATAYKLADSIRTAIQNGANFDSLCVRFSDDGGKNDQQTGLYNGGVYDNVPTGKMVPAFNDFIFSNPVGSKGIVNTEFGSHYVEILSQKGSSPAYKVAYLYKPIFASNETDQDASSRASQFAGNARDEKSFNETFEKQLRAKGYNKGIAYDIQPNSYEVSGLGVSREFVRAIYDSKKGNVLQPIKVGSNYVVALVTEVSDKGVQSVAKARLTVEPALRNKKKAAQIIKQIGTISTLEAAAATLAKPIETDDSLRFNGGKVLGYEPRVTGAAFNPDNKGKVISQAIEGNGGIYVVRVDNVIATPTGGNIDEQRKAEANRMRQMAMFGGDSPLKALREDASIKDNRSKHYQ